MRRHLVLLRASRSARRLASRLSRVGFLVTTFSPAHARVRSPPSLVPSSSPNSSRTRYGSSVAPQRSRQFSAQLQTSLILILRISHSSFVLSLSKVISSSEATRSRRETFRPLLHSLPRCFVSLHSLSHAQSVVPFLSQLPSLALGWNLRFLHLPFLWNLRFHARLTYRSYSLLLLRNAVPRTS